MGPLKCLAAGTLLLAHIPGVQADTVALHATLTSAAEIPPNSGAGSGQGVFSYDTNTHELSFTITFRGLSGTATGSHIHGPAGRNANAGIVKTFVVPESPISGQSRLSDQQASQLIAGQLYVDVHTSAHPEGEIRGQIGK